MIFVFPKCHFFWGGTEIRYSFHMLYIANKLSLSMFAKYFRIRKRRLFRHISSKVYTVIQKDAFRIHFSYIKGSDNWKLTLSLTAGYKECFAILKCEILPMRCFLSLRSEALFWYSLLLGLIFTISPHCGVQINVRSGKWEEITASFLIRLW